MKAVAVRELENRLKAFVDETTAARLRESVARAGALHPVSALTLREALPDLDMLGTDERTRDDAGALGVVVVPA